jgi:hypothetical protein
MAGCDEKRMTNPPEADYKHRIMNEKKMTGIVLFLAILLGFADSKIMAGT